MMLKKIVLIICITVLLSSCGVKTMKIEKPIFPESAAVGYNIDNAKVVFKLNGEEIDDAFVYEITNKTFNYFEIKSILKKFGFDKPEKEVYAGISIYKEGDNELQITDDGLYIYTTYEKGEDFVSALTDETVKAKAEKILEEYGIALDEFCVAGYSESKISNGTSESVVGKGVSFARTVDGKRVYGPMAASVEFHAAGKTIIRNNCNKYENETKVEPDTFENIKSKILSNEAWLTYGEAQIESIDLIEITEWKFIYYDGSDMGETKYVQPCIRFIGTAFDKDGNSTSFSSTVPMLREEYYK